MRAQRAAELEAQGIPCTADPSGAIAAVVATDTSRHLADARRMIEAGCHVLIEKPIAPSRAGVAELLGADTKIFVGCCLRFHTGLLRFREQVPSIGKPHHVRIECQSYLPDWRPGTDYKRGYAARADEGGVLRDLIHEIDYATWIFGRPREVIATLTPGTSLGIASEEAADLLWRVGDATVSLRLDYVTRASRRRMTAFGSEGEITWDAMAEPMDRDRMMLAQAQSFLAAIEGKPGDLATLDDAGFAIALCDAARAGGGIIPDWRIS